MSVARPNDLKRRLLKDIAEIRQDPYPNIDLHIDDSDLTKACLILTPEYEEPLHLSIKFPSDYPLIAPVVTIQSHVLHPNVHGDYICASILNRTDGWTPAYTLKAITIQLLSFFSSEWIEQDWGGEIHISDWRHENYNRHSPYWTDYDYHTCEKCGFGIEASEEEPLQTDQLSSSQDSTSTAEDPRELGTTPTSQAASRLLTLPDEILLLTLAEMDTRDILSFAATAPEIDRVVRSYDFIRIRELQCFCLKKSFFETKLGVGVAISGSRRKPVFRSEFDLLSQEAFFQNRVDRSVQGVKFDKWLPLPLSRRHWGLIRTTVGPCLKGIHTLAGMDTKTTDPFEVLFYFMNSVVVQFSTDYERSVGKTARRSTLNHVSEKAIEAYFALFHLLLCLASEDPSVEVRARLTVAGFLAGPRGKKEFPDLGHVLVAALIAGAEFTQELVLAVIKEAILRNVVWMLDVKGADMAELAYLEPSAVSEYRLAMTFQASTTSYRLLMFLKIFSQAARPRNKTLVDLREALFDTHGAPPGNTTAMMTQRIREIHTIDDFPGFLSVMGIRNIPSKAQFTAFLRRTITDSITAGYSIMPMSQSQLYMIRRVWEPEVEVSEAVRVTGDLAKWYERGEKWHHNGWKGRPSFFPVSGGGQGEGNRGGARSRGRGGRRGRGR